MNKIDGQIKLHIFLKTFGGSHFDRAVERINNRPISDGTSRLLGIKKSNGCKATSHKAINNQALPPINSKYYVSSRHGVDDALDLYFKQQRNGQSIAMDQPKSTEIVVCERCAGHHHIDNCNATDYVCHMCGTANHRMFECQRAKCFLCFQLGHLANQCPTKLK